MRFEPHAIDRALWARGWSVGFDEVDAVEVARRRPFSHVFGAGFRRQLCVEAGGVRTYFVVNRVEDAVAELRRLMGTV